MTNRSEKSILNETLVDVSALPGALVWRNNTGQAWQGVQREARIGQFVKVEPGMVILENARPINFGLKGSGDIIGAIQQHPLAVETKTETGRQSEGQTRFQRAWERVGGIYVLARSPQDAVAQIKERLRKSSRPS